MASRRKPPHREIARRIVRATRSRRFAGIYLIGALGLLFLTTIYWSIVGASIQSSNADQLANTFLLDSPASAAGMLLPSQHTFLLKVPLFGFVSLFGSEPAVFVAATAVLSLLTVFGLVFVLSRIERRPLVLGTIVLALSAVLLYIPAQSYPGSLLPLNYAMLTTRNIEYVLFVGALIMTVRTRRLRGPSFVIACAAFILLLASDRLFVSLGAGTALLSGLVFLITKRRDLLRVSVRLTMAVGIGFVGAALLLFLLGRAGVHFDSGGAAGPYGFVRGPKDFVIALIYGVLGLLANLGANPAYDGLIVRELPAHIIGGLFSPAGPGYVVTAVIAGFIGLGAIRAVRFAFVIPKRRGRHPVPEWQTVLPVLLAATTVSALSVFVLSNHYYPADARYLAIVLPTGFIALAAAARRVKRLRPQWLLRLGALACIGIAFGVVFQIQNAVAQNQALGEISTRNEIVAAALKNHPVGTLLGNYWRVLPIRLGSPTLSVTPLEGCTVPRRVLSSSAWQPDLHTTSFAYILRLDGGLAGYPACSLDAVTKAYGRPDSSVVIAGTRRDPREILLFYDQGIHFLKEAAVNSTPVDTVKPVSVDQVPFTTCPAKTVMQFIAHEDDDLLFMDPDLTHSIKAGDCIRTVYFTAGDAGSDRLYWLGRQHGAEEAYNTILGTPGNPWTERVVSLDAAHTVTVANPRGNHMISLIFLHLPDGNPEGTGFASKHFESLHKLSAGTIPAVHPVDAPEESYSAAGLAAALTHLMTVYKPAELRSQSTYAGTSIKDHSDHNAVGTFTTRAYDDYVKTGADASITYYMGYPVHTLPANVTGEDYTQKVAAFLTFGRFDGATCHTLAECNTNAVYGLYLARQYTYPY